MNIFGIGALVAFALCAGTALWRMYRYKARVDTLSKDNLFLTDRMHGIEAERDALREQLDKAQTREKAAGEQRHLVQEHLDVLSSRKPRSRAKPPTTTE